MTSKNTDSPSVLLGMPNMNGTASIRLPCNKRKNTIYLHIHISFNRKWHGFNKHEWKPLSKQHMQQHPAGSPENRSTKRNTSGSEALFGGLLLSTSSFTSLHVTSDLPVFFFMLMMEVSTFRATCSSPSNRATCWIEFPAAWHSLANSGYFSATVQDTTVQLIPSRTAAAKASSFRSWRDAFPIWLPSRSKHVGQLCCKKHQYCMMLHHSGMHVQKQNLYLNSPHVHRYQNQWYRICCFIHFYFCIHVCNTIDIISGHVEMWNNHAFSK